MSLPKFYTLEEVRLSLGVSRSALYHWASQRRIKSHKFGNRLYFAEKDILAFIAESEREPIEEKT